MTSPDAPRVAVGSPAGTPTAWLADAAQAPADSPTAASPTWADGSPAYCCPGGDETTMNSPCL